MRRPRYSFSDVEQRVIRSVEQRGKLEPTAIGPLASPVHYRTDKNFTYAFYTLKDGTQVVGAAKRNPNDQYNPEVGKQVAFTRAISRERE